MEREGKYTLIIKERPDGFFAFKFYDLTWHEEGCLLTNVVRGRGEFFAPRYFINDDPGVEIDYCTDCKNWEYVSNTDSKFGGDDI